MTDFDNGRDSDPESYAHAHGLSKRERCIRDPAYGDWLFEQEKDRRIEEEIDAEGRYWAGVGKRGKKKVEAEK